MLFQVQGRTLMQKREEVFILNGMVFTFLLWIKLDHGHVLELLTWPIVCVPLWCNNLLGVYCAYRRIRRFLRNYAGLEFEWWPQSSKNAVILSGETMMEEWVSLVFKLALIFMDGPSYVIKFSPLWIAVVINLYLFYIRKPRVGVAVKPRYIFALMVALKLDGWNDFPWHFQFAPLWFLLSVVFCCVLMFAINVNHRRLNPFKRKAFHVAAATTLVVTIMSSAILIELAKYLEGMVRSFSLVAIFMLATQLVTLGGLMLFGYYVQRDRETQRRPVPDKEEEIVLEFIDAPEDVFIRESTNLFRRPAEVRPRLDEFSDSTDLTLEECVICCVEGANYILLECGHGNFCEGCCRELAKRSCPMCRQSISRVGKLANKKLESGDSTFVILNGFALVTKASAVAIDVAPSDAASADAPAASADNNNNNSAGEDAAAAAAAAAAPAAGESQSQSQSQSQEEETQSTEAGPAGAAVIIEMSNV